jgi:hypothetical protein
VKALMGIVICVVVGALLVPAMALTFAAVSAIPTQAWIVAGGPGVFMVIGVAIGAFFGLGLWLGERSSESERGRL